MRLISVDVLCILIFEGDLLSLTVRKCQLEESTWKQSIFGRSSSIERRTTPIWREYRTENLLVKTHRTIAVKIVTQVTTNGRVLFSSVRITGLFAAS